MGYRTAGTGQRGRLDKIAVTGRLTKDSTCFYCSCRINKLK